MAPIRRPVHNPPPLAFQDDDLPAYRACWTCGAPLVSHAECERRMCAWCSALVGEVRRTRRMPAPYSLPPISLRWVAQARILLAVLMALALLAVACIILGVFG